MAWQSLYRRYRPRRFSEVKGQDHVVTALRNAVRDDRVGHAYLFSGPRGTGKTTSARILAKALNCADVRDGEPCLVCESCVAIEAGTSYDLHELDAASNNGVEAMRELIGRAALGTPGRTKVYILDEVHMLSPGASNALLKTLEEPPDHVVFALATTDPHKVLPTIRSRTQHFELHLLPAEELESLVRWIAADAGLDIDDEIVAHVVRVGAGSARDTLSALDQVVAAGGVDDRAGDTGALVTALLERDPGAVLAAVHAAVASGRDPRVLAEDLVRRVRDAFLSAVGVDLEHLPEGDRARTADLAAGVERPFLTRALEVLGEALVDMRQAADSRITLEAALIRLADVRADTSVAALVERVDRLERALAAGVPPSGGLAAPAPGPPVGAGAGSPRADDVAPAGPATVARRRLAARAGSDPTDPAPAAGDAPAAAEPPVPTAPARGATGPTPAAEPPVPTGPGRGPAGPAPAAAAAPPVPAAPGGPVASGLPSREELTLAWGDTVLGSLAGLSKALFKVGRFTQVSDAAAVFALPTEPHRKRCEDHRAAVEAALAQHFGRPVPLRLVVEAATAPPHAPAEEPEEHHDLDITTLVDAPAPPTRSAAQRLTDAFPGAVVEEGSR